MEEEEASPNRANAQGGAGEKSRIRCVGSVAPRIASRFNSRRTRSNCSTRTPATRERRRTVPSPNGESTYEWS